MAPIAGTLSHLAKYHEEQQMIGVNAKTYTMNMRYHDHSDATLDIFPCMNLQGYSVLVVDNVDGSVVSMDHDSSIDASSNNIHLFQGMRQARINELKLIVPAVMMCASYVRGYVSKKIAMTLLMFYLGSVSLYTRFRDFFSTPHGEVI